MEREVRAEAINLGCVILASQTPTTLHKIVFNTIQLFTPSENDLH